MMMMMMMIMIMITVMIIIIVITTTTTTTIIFIFNYYYYYYYYYYLRLYCSFSGYVHDWMMFKRIEDNELKVYNLNSAHEIGNAASFWSGQFLKNPPGSLSPCGPIAFLGLQLRRYHLGYLYRISVYHI